MKILRKAKIFFMMLAAALNFYSCASKKEILYLQN